MPTPPRLAKWCGHTSAVTCNCDNCRYDIHSFITTIKGSDYILYTTMYLNILYINTLGVCAILNVLERHYTSFSVGKLI